MSFRAGLARFVVGVSLTSTFFAGLAGLAAMPAQAATGHTKKKPAKPVSVISRPGGPQYESIVVDADTGQVLHEVNADVASPPASLTKMMTLYLLFDAIKRGEVRMTTPMKVSARAAAQAPTKIGLARGKAITVDQAIDAEVTKSANDVAVVIAEHLGGTEDHFGEMMTAMAQKMGMTKTFFHNASGLPDPQQMSSARDMAILAKHLIHDHPDLYPLFSRLDFAYGNQTIHTHNHLLEFYEGADGIKTGYTYASGYNLVTSAKRDGHRLIGVVFGGATANARDRHMADLLDDGFAKANGQPESLVASNRIEEFQKINLAAAAQVKPTDVPESAGDRDEAYKAPTTIAAVIQATELPPAPHSDVAAMAAPKLAALPVRNKPAQTEVASLTPDDQAHDSAQGGKPVSQVLSAPPPGTWGIQIGAFGNADKANTEASDAADSLKTEFPGATAVVQATTAGGKKLYRAQIHGLAQKDLIRACALITVQPSSACKALPPEAAKT